MRSLVCPVLLAFAGLVGAGCGGGGDDDGAVPVDSAPPAAIDGAWRVTRVAPSQPADCRAITPNPLDVTFAFGAATPIVVAPGSMLRDYDQVVGATTASFVTEDYAFSAEPGRPVLIIHHLQVAGDQLTGTASAMGDGDDLGCHWTMDLVGTRR